MANVEFAIKLPFTLGATGIVEVTTDQNKIWADRALSVVGTAIGERVQRYYFGSKVHTEFFDTASGATTKLPEIIAQAFAAHLPLLTLNNVSVDFDEDTKVLEAIVFYSLPNDEQSQLRVGNISLNGNLPFKEN
jgi:phage baseplate assembly protein W